MKRNLLNQPKLRNIFLRISVLLLTNTDLVAQLPDCLSGATMYGVFNNLAGSTTADSMEIRPINYSTGAVGPLIGSKRYWVRKQIGFTWYYGSSAMGVNLVNNKFYVMTQMSNAGAKDIISIDPVAATMTVVGTTPTSLNNYHFVKLAVAPNGFAYAIGVNRDTSQPAATFNPLVRFSTCGMTPTAGCATPTITILGYLPVTGNMYKWKLFNGDIAFDYSGNLYFCTAAYERVAGSTMAYTNARLFKIDVANIPTTGGTGTIPMTLLADYPSLDSTVMNGIALDLSGNMYVSTRVFNGPQGNPSTTQSPKLFKSTNPGTATDMAGFISPTPNFSVADLASCNYPNQILWISQVRLTGRAENGKTDLKWELNNNDEVDYFELQRSDNANDFKTIAKLNPSFSGSVTTKYSYTDNHASGASHAYYRVKATMKSGVRNYSNVMNILLSGQMLVVSAPNPNPFVDRVDFVLSMKNKSSVSARILDQRGSIVKQVQMDSNAGENRMCINGLGHLKPGMYIIELSVDEQVLRSKMIKQ